MRFRSLRARVFGPLRGRELALGPDVVLVFGPNESGKSSFRSAVETILYGFEPASRETHPLYRFDEVAGDLHVEAELSLDSGELIGVERVLQATGKSRTRRAGESFEGVRQGNAALSQVAHLPRALFRAIYALELEQLAALEDSLRSHVDDLLLPGRDALSLRTPALVLRELREAHQRLWRADNRGRPRARELRNELAVARSRERQVAERERSLRGARQELEALEQGLSRHRQRRRELEIQADEAPILGAIFELARRKQGAGSEPDLSALGGFPLQDPSLLEREADELAERQLLPRARLERPAVALTDSARWLLHVAPDVEVGLRDGAELASERARQQEREEDTRLLRRSASRELQPLFTRPLDEAILGGVELLPLEALRLELQNWSEAYEHERSGLTPPPPPPFWPLFTGAAGFIAVTLAAFAVVPYSRELTLLGAALVFASLVVLWQRRRPAGQAEPPPRPAGVDALLAALPVDPRLLATPTGLQRVVDAFARARLSLEDANEKDLDAEVRRAALEEREFSLRALAADHGLSSEGTLDVLLGRLGQALAEAQEEERAVAADLREREDAARSLAELEPLLARRREHLAALTAVLGPAEPEARSLGEAWERLEARRQELRFVREREAELRRDPRYERCAADPRLQSPEPPHDAPWNPAVEAARNAEIRELDEAILKGARHAGELRQLLDSASAGDQARAADRVAELAAELDELCRERDRLALLENLIARAEREFREQHQPDVLRRASDYLRRVSRGRYTRLSWHDAQARAEEGESAGNEAASEPGPVPGSGAGADGALFAELRGRSEPVRVGPPLSRGTLDQIHLCFRLGLLDHLDEGRERLPLILDDALLRMDDARRRAAYALLKELAGQRQVFLLTCHEALAREAAGAWSVEPICLEPTSAAAP